MQKLSLARVSKLLVMVMFAVTFMHIAPAKAAITSGSLVKSPSFSAVYYVGADGKRYVFFNSKVYSTWYQNFATVQTITDNELASLRIGGNVTYRPGVKMIKIQSDPKVYAVAFGGVLRHVSSEAIAATLYGPSWNQLIDDVDVTEFVNYRIGATINAASDFNTALETGAAATINIDKRLTSSTPTPTPNPTPTPTPSGQLTFRLNGQTPSNSSVARGATGVRVLTFDIRHDGSTATTVDSVSVRRFGTGTASDISRVSLYAGDTRISSSFVWDSSDRTTIAGLNLAISPGQTHVLTLVADFSVNATQTRNSTFEISSVVAGGQQVSGNPIQGNTFTISATVANTLTLSTVSSGSGLVRGSVDETFGIFRLTAGDSESVRINRILLQVATDSTSLSNVKLFNGNTLLSTVATLDNVGRANFSLSNPVFDVLANSSVDLTVKATISAAASSQVYKVYLGQDSDISATGVLTGNSVQVNRAQFDNSLDNGSDALFALVTSALTFSIVDLGPKNISVQQNAANINQSATPIPVLQFTVRNDSPNPVALNSISVMRTGSGTNADISALFIGAGTGASWSMTNPTGANGSWSYAFDRLGASNNMTLMNPGQTKTITVYEYVSSSAVVGNQSTFSVATVSASTQVGFSGLSSLHGSLTTITP